MKLSQTSFVITSVVVITLYLSVIAWVVFSAQPLNISNLKEKLVVQTLSLQPAKPKPMEKENKEVTPTPAAPKPVQKPPRPKNEPPSKPPIKKTEAKKAPLPEKPKENPKEAMLNRAKESLAKLQQTRDNFKGAQKGKAAALEDVRMIDALSIDTSEANSGENGDYYSELSAKLKQALRLPEKGEVRLRLTLGRSGNVAAVNIQAAKSEYNGKYVEAMLKKIRLPPFGKYFEKETEHTFTLTLMSE